MKRPLRYRTMGAVREGRGNPSPYSIKDCADYSQFGKGFLRLTCWPAEVSDGSY